MSQDDQDDIHDRGKTIVEEMFQEIGRRAYSDFQQRHPGKRPEGDAIRVSMRTADGHEYHAMTDSTIGDGAPQFVAVCPGQFPSSLPRGVPLAAQVERPQEFEVIGLVEGDHIDPLGYQFVDGPLAKEVKPSA